MEKNRHLIITVNVDWFFLSHRLPIALAAKKNGYDVTIAARDTGRKNEIEQHGLKFIDIPFDRSGANPLHELKCVHILRKLYKQESPDVIHHVTLKASLLGSLAAKLTKKKNVVNAISGFGYNFTDERKGLKQTVIKSMMKLAFKSNSFHYIFQNPNDVDDFSGLDFAPDNHIHLIKGSGVDLNQFSYQKEEEKDKVRVILPARILYDKGVVEFIEAAKILKEKLENKAEFILMGDCDTHNLAGIKEEDLVKMMAPPYLMWTGFEKDIFSALKNADIVVLPSYREGLPKSLIEACAVGRPIVTTDTQGCRECVQDGYNGFLVPVKDYKELADKMDILINDRSERERMGLNSRILAETEFSIETVVERHLEIYNEMLER
ncbi:glycosyltransferase involved in cell wall biosynthesis [Dysgonomonas sp. PFB1-18]|uniref:glycosyltransferase family 4 protein n=1 Tax=unclassified Dysgonomonas TaxID=2630389 RepID=UPI00247719F3|nr:MULTISPECIES: glycosyltransferase family 4 protein [unclassified Dysgonomonas]MDH6307766.1 glycosyltransferase involved in cell wall biosynthesis [Dysgonomonas sp. PF1-14]MDH6337684.1 glycosyltransferase involved in cell wall biosynthesis [Dysgonomonas sp. PF1-16]MDH6378908.1 glycosyltransferase involved in cell wall biosynthesis [Dysgonomonas sp. PFB1-18]MDH6396543.1 glycosyltransferase involved in cell wall biosynthesis [Dysgonomonas sp. PF1-23]